MSSKYWVRLNGESITDISDKIKILDVKESSPSVSVDISSNGIYGGSKFLRKIRNSLSVSIEFVILDKDMSSRKSIMARVHNWMKDGYLTLSDRPGQRLYVRSTQIPYVASSKDFTSSIRMVLTAYEFPWWENETEQIVELKSAKEGSLELLLDGNADYAPLSCTIAPSSTMTKFTLMSNSDTIKLEGLSIDNGNKLLINNDNFILSIKDNNGDSKLNNLLDSSDDNIRLNPGIVNKIKFVSDVNCDVKISSKGCWK